MPAGGEQNAHLNEIGPAKRPPAKAASGRETFRLVQALRGVAACMVVLFHASGYWSVAVSGNSSRAWLGGASGVDIFFAISGFVMAVSYLHKEHGPQAARRFLAKRVVRVIPLYWLITTVFVLKFLLFPKHPLEPAQRVSWVFGLCSYLLIPCRNGAGTIFPVVVPGWTLTFEMFFYLCFAAALCRRKSVFPILTLGLGVLALVGIFRVDSWPAITSWCSPLLLEFVGGLWLGRAALQGVRIDRRLSLALGLAGWATLCVLPIDTEVWGQRLLWGMCGLLVVQAAVLLEESWAAKIPPWLLLVGNASYAIYLTQFPLLGVYALSRAKVMVPGRAGWTDEAITMLVCLALAVPVGVAVHLWIELPLNDWSRRRLGYLGSAPLQRLPGR